MSLVKCGNVVDLVIFVIIKCPNWKAQLFNFVQSDEQEDNAEFLMINPNVLDQDLKDSDSVSNATAASTIINNVLLPNEMFDETYFQFNEG